MITRTLRTCKKGHKYHKSTDCPTCPVCEAARKPENSFLVSLGAPARRALEQKGITTEEHLAKYTRSAILKLHGLGPSTIPKLEKALSDKGLSFKKN
jgi:predicted RecB family nuclease